MDEDLKQLIERARATYAPVVRGPNSRIARGEALWSEFDRAATDSLKGVKTALAPLGERINELAVAKILADDPVLTGTITYEPNILPDGRRIDFVADRTRDNLYVEVKTVHPDTKETEAAWARYERCRKLQPAQAEFIVHKDWMGGSIYGNAFTARSRFLDYTLDFETRLAAAKLIKDGPGVLVFCGNGFRWHRSNLEDFADFYRAGKHRQDDSFALMEQHYLNEEKLQLLRNVDHFACLTRRTDAAVQHEFVWPMRGPAFGGVIKDQ